jgi:prephenate dehydrogenase (NADP+)
MEIGIIGLGDMGKLYALKFVEAGYIVHGCGSPGKRESKEKELAGTGINVLEDATEVVKKSDFIVFCVQTEKIAKVVEGCGEFIRPGAIVGGQTSVKTPEIKAFEKYLSKEVNIVTCHSLHGPSVDLKGQTLVVIKHRSSDEAYKKALEIFKTLDSEIVEIPTYQEHDKITADTQVVTHMALLSMGTAWKNVGAYPWESSSYDEGIDNVKILLALRVYSGKSHVYAGLALLNPFAKKQVKQYASSTSELLKIMMQEKEEEFKERIKKAGNFVFGDKKELISLDAHAMKEFNLGDNSGKHKPNSHLSLLAMVDSWYQLGINPYDNLICQTPLFRLRLGIAEYLFKNKELLEESIQAAIYDKGIRSDDLEFHSAVKEWASIVEHENMEGYKQQFEEIRSFFEKRLAEAKEKSTELIKKLVKSS